MAADCGVDSSGPHDAERRKNDAMSADERAEKRKERIYATVFLGTVTSVSILVGFGSALAAARKKDPKFFGEGLMPLKGTAESGASLALRALGWGTFFAVTGCGALFYSIWKLSGATTALDFRMKMGSWLPKIPRNDPPQSRTEFEGLTDLLTYLAEDYGKKKKADSFQETEEKPDKREGL